jgi:hypothetical protein
VTDQAADIELDDVPLVLTLTIDNSVPIELSEFLGLFTSLAAEYRGSTNLNENLKNDPVIYVKQVRSGSIIADLIPVVVQALPIIATQADQIWNAIEFVDKWAERIKSLAKGVVPDGFGKSELKTFTDATRAIAHDPKATAKLEAATFEDGKRKIRAAFKFSTSEAIELGKTIDAEYKRLETPKDSLAERVLMIFTRSDINDAPPDKRSGERVLISEISDRELPLIYASGLAEERIKHETRETDENIFKKGFVVDVMVLKKGERPVAYKVLNVHSVIDLPDED